MHTHVWYTHPHFKLSLGMCDPLEKSVRDLMRYRRKVVDELPQEIPVRHSLDKVSGEGGGEFNLTTESRPPGPQTAWPGKPLEANSKLEANAGASQKSGWKIPLAIWDAGSACPAAVVI